MIMGDNWNMMKASCKSYIDIPTQQVNIYQCILKYKGNLKFQLALCEMFTNFEFKYIPIKHRPDHQLWGVQERD